MEIREAIEHAKKVAGGKYTEGMLCHANPNDDKLDSCIECAKKHEQLAGWLEELQQYQSIGTVEECQEAREKQKGKKPIVESKKKIKIQTGDYVYVKCPCCGEDIFSCFYYLPWNDSQKSHKHCQNCGQFIDWSDTN